MQRILIIGPCGAGKSTLAIKLGKRLDLPVFHMDQLNWKSGWIESSKEELLGKIANVIAADRWIIDGTYGGTLAERIARADTVIYLDFPIRLCILRLLKRIWTYRGRSRPDMTEGCPERFDAAFLWYLICWNSGPKLRMEQRIRGHENKIIRLKSPAVLNRWLDSLG